MKKRLLILILLAGCHQSCPNQNTFLDECAKACSQGGVMLADYQRDLCICNQPKESKP